MTFGRKRDTESEAPPFEAPAPAPAHKAAKHAPAFEDAAVVLDALAVEYRQNGDGARATAMEHAARVLRGKGK